MKQRLAHNSVPNIHRVKGTHGVSILLGNEPEAKVVIEEPEQEERLCAPLRRPEPRTKTNEVK